MPTKFHIAPPGTNPMEQPELYKKKRASQTKLILAIILSVLVLGIICGGPIYLISHANKAAASQDSTISPQEAPTATETAIVIVTMPAITQDGLEPVSATPTATRTATAPWPTLAPTQTPRIITQVVTKIVKQPVAGQPYPVKVTQLVDRIITQIVVITATPGPTSTLAATQTPWVIYETVVVVETVIVEVTPTPTETPTETPTLLPELGTITETPTLLPELGTITETPTPEAYPAP